MPPASLTVVGAAAGMGRWLVVHLFSGVSWRQVTLVDVAGTQGELGQLAAGLAGPVEVVAGDGPAPACAGPGVVVLAVPPEQLAAACARLPGGVTGESTVVVVADVMVPALATARAVLGEQNVLGLHPLFERSATSTFGQTVYAVPPSAPTTPSALGHTRVTDLLRAAGIAVRVGTETAHDAAMAYVQSAAHQALVGFADLVSGAGLDLQEQLWAVRTPLFETLLALSVRVLDPSQQATIARIAATEGGRRVGRELAALDRAGDFGERITQVRDRFAATLFDTAQHVAAMAVTAAQSTREALARHLASGEVVGVRNLRRPGSLHIGRIVEVGTTEVVVRDLYVSGGRGGVLLDGPGLANRRRIGAGGRPADVRLGIGHVTVLTGAELDAELDRRLAFIRRDVRFLVPESVSGAGVLRTVSGVAGTRGHRLSSEVVRTGQRSVVVSLGIRADRDVDETTEALRVLVQHTYQWPRGLCRPVPVRAPVVRYLGPAGTFSEVAARQCATAAQLVDPVLAPLASFEEVLGGLDDRTVAVLPISSSSSGLVTRSAEAVRRCPADLLVGGVVDVSVRIDSYIKAGQSLQDLRGARLFSHPQALAQCSSFIARWRLDPVPVASTAEALVVVAESTQPAVALASADADVTQLGLKVGEREVDDIGGSITRFLILGTPGVFQPFSAEYTPTLRDIWVGGAAGGLWSLLGAQTDGAFDEVLSDGQGNALWITSRRLAPSALPSMRLLGTAPWSPRTPVVRVSPPR